MEARESRALTWPDETVYLHEEVLLRKKLLDSNTHGRQW